MPRLVLILLISWTCAGCALSPARSVRDPDLSHRPLRFLETEPELARAVQRSAVSRPATLTAIDNQRGPGVGDPEQASCSRFRVAPPADPETLVATWEAGLRRPGSAHRWLLGSLVGSRDLVFAGAAHASGLRVEGGTLVVCAAHPMPDWSSRVAHPELWPHRVDPVSLRAYGDGPFRWSADGTALVRSESGPASRLERIELLQAPDREAADWISRGQVDLAIVYGVTADTLLTADALPVRLERIPGWDKVYALWLNPASRWVNDPRFRRWLAGTIDRDALVRLVFGGRGEPAFRLLAGKHETAPWPTSGRPPIAPSSSPRLALTFDEEDPHARSIAARIKAVLEQAGLVLDLEPRSAEERRALLDGRFQMALVVHHSPIADPVLALQNTLWPLGPSAAEAFQRLDRASRISPERRRYERAALVEDSLLADARLIPLVQLHAWLVRHKDLIHVRAGRYGILRLERAEWTR